MAGSIFNACTVLEAAEKTAVRIAPRPGFNRISSGKADMALEDIQKTAAVAFSRFGQAALVSLSLEEVALLGPDLD